MIIPTFIVTDPSSGTRGRKHKRVRRMPESEQELPPGWLAEFEALDTSEAEEAARSREARERMQSYRVLERVVDDVDLILALGALDQSHLGAMESARVDLLRVLRDLHAAYDKAARDKQSSK